MEWKQFLQNKSQLFKSNYARAPIYAKVVTHRLTPFLVFVCINLKLRPTQVTALSLLVGWAAAFCFTIPSPEMVLLSALLLESYYVLDSVDGQLARMTGQSSKTGAFFDILLNYLVHPLIFIGIGVGQSKLNGTPYPLLAGAVCALAYIWLGAMWNVRAHVLFESLPARLERKAEGGEKEKQETARALFSFLHKLCTFPTLMNLITLTSLLAVFTRNLGFLNYLLGFYSVVLPFVSLGKIAKMILAHEPDREYESYSRD